MKKILCLSILLALLLTAYQYSMAESAKLTLLKDIDVVTSVDTAKIELRFTGTPNEKGISYHENFMQVVFPDTYVNPAKQWINVEDKIVKTIYLYQFDATTVRARFFTVGKAGKLKDKISLLREENNIIITYHVPSEADRATSVPADKAAVVAEAVSKISGSVEETPNTAIPPSATISKNTPGDKPLIPDGTGSPDLYASFLKMILVLGILLTLLFAGLFVFKRFLGKKIGIAGQNPGIKVVTSAYIGPKKSIALVDISGERIVVGITPNHISMLARLGKDGDFGNILEEQMSLKDKVELHDDLWEKV